MAEIHKGIVSYLHEFDKLNLNPPIEEKTFGLVSRYISEIFGVLDFVARDGLLLSGICRPGQGNSRDYTLTYIPSQGEIPAHLAYTTIGRNIGDIGTIIATSDRPTFVYNYSKEMQDGLKVMLQDLGGTVFQLLLS
ncbi:hypothetical protein HYT59_01615 [Candidatus Woesebacteria bacterium]|nr:hypothetical protein [Candidatus Woesebacteria bacterium]